MDVPKSGCINGLHETPPILKLESQISTTPSSPINAKIHNSDSMDAQLSKINKTSVQAFQEILGSKSSLDPQHLNNHEIRDIKSIAESLNDDNLDNLINSPREFLVTYNEGSEYISLILTAQELEEFTESHNAYENLQITPQAATDGSMSLDALNDLGNELKEMLTNLSDNLDDDHTYALLFSKDKNQEVVETKSLAEAQKHERKGGLAKLKNKKNGRIYLDAREGQRFNMVGVNFIVVPESLKAKLEKYNNFVLNLMNSKPPPEEKKTTNDLHQIIMNGRNNHTEKSQHRHESGIKPSSRTFSHSSITSFIITMKQLTKELEIYKNKKQQESKELTKKLDKAKSIESQETSSLAKKNKNLEEEVERGGINKKNLGTEKTKKEFVEKTSTNEKKTVVNKIEEAVKTDEGLNPYNEDKD